MEAPSYEYYRDSYRGSMGEAEYLRFSHRAAAYLEQITFGRVNGVMPPAVEQKAGMACCAVADAIFREESPKVVSETVGSWSRSYEAEGGVPSARVYQAAALYLGMTGLLYKGV